MGVYGVTLDHWRKRQGWTWERVARELSMLCKSYGEDAVYPNRVWMYRKGKQKPAQHHVRALQEMTGDEVESFRE